MQSKNGSSFSSCHNSKASAVARKHAAVCVGLSHVYAAALRANGIPARTLSVLLALDPKPDDNTEDPGHAVNEFFIDRIGWLPADLTVDDSGWTVDSVRFGQTGTKQPPADFRKKFSEQVRDKMPDINWTMEWTGNGSGKTENKSFYALRVKPTQVETGDCTGAPRFSVPTSCYSVYHDNAGWHLRSMPGKDTRTLLVELKIDGQYTPATKIMLGRKRTHPSLIPFLLPASGQPPQPQSSAPAGE